MSRKVWGVAALGLLLALAAYLVWAGWRTPEDWLWLVVIGWTGFRLLLAVWQTFWIAANAGRNIAGPFIFTMFASGLVWMLFGAFVLRPFGDLDFGTVQAALSSALTLLFSGLLGMFFGLLVAELPFDFLALYLAGALVAWRADWSAEQLTFGDAQQRVRAAQALGFIGSSADFAVPQLLDNFKDSDADLRYHIARAFLAVGAGDPAIDPAMQMGLADPEARVRIMAACVLVRRGKTDAATVFSVIREGLRSDHWEVKHWAFDSLKRLGPGAAPAIPDLVAIIGEADWSDKCSAGEVLCKIGAAAREALPALRKLVANADRATREAAQDAINEIGPDGEIRT